MPAQKHPFTSRRLTWAIAGAFCLVGGSSAGYGLWLLYNEPALMMGDHTRSSVFALLGNCLALVSSTMLIVLLWLWLWRRDGRSHAADTAVGQSR